MGLETATFISQLNPANPVGSVDNYSTADDHLRLLKAVLLAQFPNLGAAAVTPTAAQVNFLVGVTSALQTQLDAKEILANKNAANGYAGLNASSQLLDARVQVSNVTQHQGSLALAGSQITSGLVPTARLGGGAASSGNYLRGDQNWSTIATADVTSGTFADARIAASNVTQHQAALAIACSQLTGSMPDARIVASNVTQHQGSLAIAGSQVNSGTIPSARVTAVDAACTISGNLIGFRDVPNVTGSWARNSCREETTGATFNTSDMGTGFTFSFYNNSAANQTLTQGAGVTMRKSGTATTGNLTVLPRGLVTLWCRSATEVIVTGSLG